jgi:hypothetical protein
MGAKNAFSALVAWVARKRRQRRLQKEKERAIRKATEAVIDATDPKIRQVGGYLKKLGPAVERAVRFADEIVDRLPGPVEVATGTWATDPYVRAFFTSVDELREALRLSHEIVAFFKERPFVACHALLTMRRLEQTVFGTEQLGEIVRRDVAKTAVNFVDHRFVSPCETEAETKGALKARVLSVLSEYAYEKIRSLRGEKKELQEQREAVKTTLKVLREEFPDSEGLGGEEERQAEKRIREAEDLLTEMDRRIDRANSVLNDPGGCLAHVAGVLNQPRDHMKMETVTLRLSPMGIKVGHDSQETWGEIVLTEIGLGKGGKRVAVVVRLQRAEVLES